MVEICPVTDAQDPRISAYANIRERDLVGRQDRFIAEGKVVLDLVAASSRFQLESVLLLHSRLDAMRGALALLPADLPVYTVERPIMDGVAGFPVHRGILAIGRRGREASVSELLAAQPPRSTILMLSAIANHDNIGAIFRNAAAFGAGAVLLDRFCCDPLYRKAIRVSVGTTLTVPFTRGGDVGELAGEVAAAGYDAIALSPRADKDLSEMDLPERVALVLGSEGHGLPEAAMNRMRRAGIAMASGIDSLNVAAASAVALHHLFRRQREDAG